MDAKKFLEAVRRKHACTNAELARRYEIDKANLSKMEHGAQPIPDPLAAEMAADAGMNPVAVLSELKGGRWKRVAEKLSGRFKNLLTRANPRNLRLFRRA